jgi:hypothetical protein
MTELGMARGDCLIVPWRESIKSEKDRKGAGDEV